MTVVVKDLRFSYGRGCEDVLDGISFVAETGQVTVLVGANGAGKTTTLKCIAGLYEHGGQVSFDGSILSQDDLTEKLSYMEQNTDCSINLDVFSMVLLGKIQELGFRVMPEDIESVNEVLDLVGVRHLASRKICEISGGQRQLVFLAQALVKKPDILLLDEPAGALDLYHQVKLMKLIRRITEERGCVTIVTLHHLDMAMKYANNVVVIHNKKVYDYGPPDKVFTERMLDDVYRVKAEILTDSRGERFMHLLDTEDEGSGDPLQSQTNDSIIK